MDFELPNIFLRLFSHRPQSNVTPTENFVTEAFAIVLSMRPEILQGFLEVLGVNDIPANLRIDTQVRVGSCCFDILVSNERDVFFPIECKLNAAFGKATSVQESQLDRYAAEVRLNPATHKGLISLTARSVPSRCFDNVRFSTARWTDVIELCERYCTEDNIGTALTKHFVELLRFLKVDRGLDSRGRLNWKCDLCGLEASGEGIYSHQQKHCRLANEYLRDEFERILEPHSESISTMTNNLRALRKIEMGNYEDSEVVMRTLRESDVPAKFWLHVAENLRSGFSNSAYSRFTSEMAGLVDVEQFTISKYISDYWEAALTMTAGQATSGSRNVVTKA